MTEEEALKDVALKLFWNLHTGASENIISSLLAASFNDSEDFRRELLNKLVYSEGTFTKNDIKNLYAYTNKGIPHIMKGDEPTCSLPDVQIRCDEEEQKWVEADNNGSQNAAKSAKAVFIEVKHTRLSKIDKVKYENFMINLSKLKRQCPECGGKRNRHTLPYRKAN